MIQNVPVIDFHCHFPVKGDWFPDYPHRDKVQFDETGSRDHGEIWRKAFNFPVPRPAKEDDAEIASDWIADMDAKGIEKIVWVSGGGNERLAKIVSLYPDRFFGFAHHHPDTPGAADMLEHAFRDLHLSGYKLLGPDIDTPMSDKKFYPLWELCEAYEKPVLIHYGLQGAAGGKPDGINISPLSLAQASRDFPKVNFVVPHFGCTHMQDLLQLCWTRPNVWVDTCGSNQWIRWMPYRLTLEDVMRKFIETVGPGRLIFGTDSSWMPRGFASIYLEEQQKNFRFLGLDESEMHAVLYGNAASLLRLGDK